MKLETKYDPRQWVYLVHDPDQRKRMVVEIKVISFRQHIYVLQCGSEQSEHFEYELSTEPDVSLKTDN